VEFFLWLRREVSQPLTEADIAAAVTMSTEAR
jgi:hypothetical protein